MTTCQDQLFSYSDLPLLAPWLAEDSCREFAAAGLFTPRIVQRETDLHAPCMYLYDLIALTSLQQLLRSGVTAEQLRQALYAPANFRCDGFPEEDLIFLSTGCLRGQELSRFLEVTNAELTILVRLPLAGEAEIELIPNELLGPKDYKGETLTGVECKAIRDLIKANIASVHPPIQAHQNDGQMPPSA
jgi:hypothetical protein